MWSPGDEYKFQNAIASNDIKQSLQNLMENQPEKNENMSQYIDKFSSNFTEIICRAAKNASIKLKTKKNNSNKKTRRLKHKTKPWFNDKCRTLKNDYNNLVKEIKRDPFK